MALETFTWLTEVTAAIEYAKTVRSSSFGDGYTQVAENGINSTSIKVSLRFTGSVLEAQAVRNFLLNHTVKAFRYTPPGDELALYRVDADSVRYIPQGKNYAQVEFTFNRAYGVFA